MALKSRREEERRISRRAARCGSGVGRPRALRTRPSISSTLPDLPAARALSRGGLPMLGDMAELVERAIAIDPCGERTATATPLPMRGRRVFYEIAHWSGLAAALAVASWLGFAMGTD